MCICHNFAESADEYVTRVEKTYKSSRKTWFFPTINCLSMIRTDPFYRYLDQICLQTMNNAQAYDIGTVNFFLLNTNNGFTLSKKSYRGVKSI